MITEMDRCCPTVRSVRAIDLLGDCSAPTYLMRPTFGSSGLPASALTTPENFPFSDLLLPFLSKNPKTPVRTIAILPHSLPFFPPPDTLAQYRSHPQPNKPQRKVPSCPSFSTSATAVPQARISTPRLPAPPARCWVPSSDISCASMRRS